MSNPVCSACGAGLSGGASLEGLCPACLMKLGMPRGSTLGTFEIVAPLGVGGMGEVYRARDTKLGRDVAIKVLPDEFSQNPERVARFEREARLLAALNHPNIATLYGLEESDGQQFLVMELVEGETLAERVTKGPVPVEKALRLVKQIAEGLEAAHEKGVIHRDLKPANIMITPRGRVKILDLGLAKAFRADFAERASSDSPTISRDGTEAGVIMGTPGYMSPEQARGKTVDKRSDIWSFGCILYEVLSGTSPFLGETVSDTIARILQVEPEWEALASTTPLRIRDLLNRCLTKDPVDRLHDIADARIEIARTLMEPQRAPENDVQLGREATSFRKTALIALASALVAAGVAVWSVTRTIEPAPRSVTRSILELGESLHRNAASAVVAPNGEYVAYVGSDEGSSQIYLRKLDQLSAAPIDGTEGAANLFFSRDSQWIGFVADGSLKKVSAAGGPSLTISETVVFPQGVSWGAGGIVFSMNTGTGLFHLPEDGGTPTSLTALDRDRDEKSHRFPELLPGDEAVLFTVSRSDTDSWDDASIAVASLENGEHSVVLEGGSHARYSPTGHLIYAHAGNLLAVPFDLAQLRVSGRSVPVVEGVMTLSSGHALFSLADNGSLVYAPGASRTDVRRVIAVDREGREEILIEDPRAFLSPRLSPDGLRLALQMSGANQSLWVFDLARSTLSRLTSSWNNAVPVWSPIGRELVWTSDRSGVWNLYRRVVDSSAEPERLTTSGNPQLPRSWSSDGGFLAFSEFTQDAGIDIWYLSLAGDVEARPFLKTPSNEDWPMFSPDGEWLAYYSDESGRNEIYVRRFPGGEGKQQVSTEGGILPLWSPDGRELFYRNGEKMMSVAVRSGDELSLGKPTVLFERRFVRTAVPYFLSNNVTPDGQRFIYLDDSEAEQMPSELVLVQNFSEELKRLVPAND